VEGAPPAGLSEEPDHRRGGRGGRAPAVLQAAPEGELEVAWRRLGEEGGSITEFRLTPLAADSVYSHITISFNGPELDTIHLRQKNGEQTVRRFHDVRRNQPLSDELFTFEPRPGIEVIDNEVP